MVTHIATKGVAQPNKVVANLARGQLNREN